MSKRIFISKNASDVEELSAFAALKGATLDSQSLLNFEPVESELDRSFDLIFFGSPRAVIFFKAIQSIETHHTIACVGDKTAFLLQQLGISPDFIIERSGKIQESQESFKTWVGDRTVLFPHSDRTLNTYSNTLSESQRINLCVYKTTLVSGAIETSDIYVFTSPSNYEAFIEQNKVSTDQYVIAWGESTATAITNAGGHCNHILSLSSMKELIEHLQLLF